MTKRRYEITSKISFEIEVEPGSPADQEGPEVFAAKLQETWSEDLEKFPPVVFFRAMTENFGIDVVASATDTLS